MSARTNQRKRRPGQSGTNGPTSDSGLEEPITSLRELMRRAFRLSVELDSFNDLMEFMVKYSLASSRLAALLRVQRDLHGERGMPELLQEVLAELLDEMEDKKGEPNGHG